jgi:hypothetical protein
MRITPSDQPTNSDLSYRAGRWIGIAIARLAGASAKLALGTWITSLSSGFRRNGAGAANGFCGDRKLRKAGARRELPA